MDILGIGFPELVFIFIIALMVLGPRRLPEVAGKAGRFIRDLRNMSQGFMAEWQREITAAARLDEIEEVRKELKETQQALRQSHTEIAGEATQIGQTLKSVARPMPTSSSPAAKSKPSEITPKADPDPSPPAVIPATEEVTVATSQPEKSDVPTPAVDSAIETVEISPDSLEIEKNGAGSKPTPVVSTEVVE